MTGIPSSLQALKVPITDLHPYAKNPRQGNVEALVESLKFHGQYRPVVVRRETSEILAGNHTYLAALEAPRNPMIDSPRPARMDPCAPTIGVNVNPCQFPGVLSRQTERRTAILRNQGRSAIPAPSSVHTPQFVPLSSGAE
jgi:ParB-like nuclease domain